MNEHECRECGWKFYPDLAVLIGGSASEGMITVLCPRCGIANRVEDSRRKEHGEAEGVRR